MSRLPLVVGLVLGLGACTGTPPNAVGAGTVDEVGTPAVPSDLDGPEAGGPAAGDGTERAGGSVEDVRSLTLVDQADGDSFVASDGVEYRVGLINTPEVGECYSSEATAATAAFLADGFLVEAYSSDGNGRTVARVVTADGDLGVFLARNGFADDRYFEQFRHEHPAYARAVEAAFASARAEGVGLWSACRDDAGEERSFTGNGRSAGTAGTIGRWACHPAYVHCLPIVDDLDCADVGHAVDLVGADDPYRLDGNRTTATDGVGCDSYPAWSSDQTYGYHAAG